MASYMGGGEVVDCILRKNMIVDSTLTEHVELHYTTTPV